MRINTKFVLSLLATVPTSLAAINGRCSGRNGICIATSTCSNAGGISYTGRCPNDASNIKCCDNITCRYNGRSGICKFTNQCSGTTVSGLCPGGSDFKCCISGGIDDSQCKTKGGQCMNPNNCKGSVLSNLCPGGADNKCCINGDNPCKNQGGQCIAPGSCRGTIKTGLCSTAGTQCCVTAPNPKPDDSPCKARYGSCINTSNCGNGIVNVGLCPGYNTNIKCCIRNPDPEDLGFFEYIAGSTKSSISDIFDAISHFRGESGLTVPASATLIKKIKESDSYKNMLKDLEEGIRKKINASSINSGKNISAEPGSSRGLKLDPTLGSFGVNIDYTFKPYYGHNPVTLSFWGSDRWDFEHNVDYAWYKNFFDEDVPEVIAKGIVRKGKPFDITYSFTDVIDVYYCC